jgi:hypothetical protein
MPSAEDGTRIEHRCEETNGKSWLGVPDSDFDRSPDLPMAQCELSRAWSKAVRAKL